MGAGKTIRKILIDKHMTITSLSETMGKPRPTVANTLSRDKLEIATAIEYGKALGCGLYYIDETNGRQYRIYVDE